MTLAPPRFAAVSAPTPRRPLPIHLRHPPSLRSSLPAAARLPTRAPFCRQRRTRRGGTVRALDAAQVFDYEYRASEQLEQQTRLKIAIIGFGNFGQFLGRSFAAQGHAVLAYSRSDQSAAARGIGADFFDDVHDLCERHPDVVLLCTSILSAEAVLRALPLQRLRRSTLFVDVLSVKEFPKNLLLQLLPPDFDILCTHPMFGPQSGKNSWAGLPFVYDKVRIGDSEDRAERCSRFLDIFAHEGCRMVEMSCGEHDENAAEIQFLTHTVGRLLAKLDLKSTPINTKGYETLLNLVENTCDDSFDLYNGLFMYNKNSTELIERLDLALDSLKRELFGRLHDILRKQLFESSNGSPSALVGGNGAVRKLDAAQVFDYEPLASDQMEQQERLKIAIVGFGNFGQFLGRSLVAQGHAVLAYSRSDYSADARNIGAEFYSNAHDLCEQHPDVVVLCTSILSAEVVLRSLPLQRLRRSTLFVDVFSVKEFPKNLLLQLLPLDFDILCTHPMFGPESGKNGWGGLPFVYDKVRVGDSEDRIERCRRFLDIFAQEGCRMVEMSCAEHDENAAETQFLTHTVGRVLAKLDLKSTPINTKGYETLLNLVENTCNDSFELYNGLFMYNKNSTELIERLDLALDSLKRELFGHLHDILRKQLFESPNSSSIDEHHLPLGVNAKNYCSRHVALEVYLNSFIRRLLDILKMMC